jgi:hypothetical protein
MMTNEEAERYWNELRDIVQTGLDNGTTRDKLKELAREVGAWHGRAISDRAHDATNDVLVASIHQALQTWSMIDTCRTAAENVRLAENAQAAASKAQRVAFWSMLAAWGAVVVNIVVRRY